MYLEALFLVFFATSYLGSESDNNSNFGYIGENIYLTHGQGLDIQHM